MSRESSKEGTEGTAASRAAATRRSGAWAGTAFLVAGIVLLAVSFAGNFTSAGRYVNLPPRPGERFDPALVPGTPDLPSLYRAAQLRAGGNLRDLPPARAMEILYETVADRFTHGDRATYNPYSNWVLWALGAVSPRHAYIQDPDALLRYGHSAMCGEVSYVLLRLAGMAGIRARHVHLNGHIVMESWYEGEWHAYDPDLEGVVRDESGSVLSVRKAVRRPERLRNVYEGRGTPSYMDHLMEIYTNESDDRYFSYPAGSFFDPVGHWPGRIEQLAGYARFGIPVFFLIAGFILRRRPRL